MSALGTDKLESIYSTLRGFPRSDINFRTHIERPEQELIAKFIPRECCILELGGESGTTSLIANKILQNPFKHLVLEPSSTSITKLQHVKDTYATSFHITHGFLGRNREKHEAIWDTCKGARMYDLHELEDIVEAPFDVLIADCEGCLINILTDIPNLLKNIKLIIVEFDGAGNNGELRTKIMRENFSSVHSQVHPFLNGDKEGWKLSTIKDFKKMQEGDNMIGFHEVYIKFD